jgi:hypothetical protein
MPLAVRPCPKCSEAVPLRWWDLVPSRVSAVLTCANCGEKYRLGLGGRGLAALATCATAISGAEVTRRGHLPVWAGVVIAALAVAPSFQRTLPASSTFLDPISSFASTS